MSMDNHSTEERGTSLEDPRRAVQVSKQALVFRPFIQPGSPSEAFQTLTIQEKINESLTPRINLSYADENRTIPILFFRFVGDESPIVEAAFYPYEAILSFIAEARDFVRWAYAAE